MLGLFRNISLSPVLYKLIYVHCQYSEQMHPKNVFPSEHRSYFLPFLMLNEQHKWGKQGFA